MSDIEMPASDQVGPIMPFDPFRKSGAGSGAGQSHGRARRHPSREVFDEELDNVKDVVLKIGGRVEDQILAALGALVDHDAERALAVIQADAEINELQRALAALIGATIATQAPVARDLRYLMSLDRVGYELERMGDHAASVAKQARKLVDAAPFPSYEMLEALARLAASQVASVLLAVIDLDEAKAREIAARDDEVDVLYHALFDEAVAEMRADPDNVEPGTRVLFAAHYLERIGDRVTNVAEDVVFLATGEVEDLNQ